MKKLFIIILLILNSIYAIHLHRDFFRSNPYWQIHKTAHFSIRYQKNMKKEKIYDLGKKWEKNFKNIMKLYNIRASELKSIIYVYIYYNRKDKQKHINNYSLVNIDNKLSIHYVFNKRSNKYFLYYLTKSIVQRSFGKIRNNLLLEGMAINSIKKYENIDIDVFSSWLVNNKKAFYISALIKKSVYNKTSTSIIAKPMAGSFIKYLIKTGSLSRFKEMWKYHYSVGLNRALLNFYSKNIEELQDNWREYIKNIKVSSNDIKNIKLAFHNNYAEF